MVVLGAFLGADFDPKPLPMESFHCSSFEEGEKIPCPDNLTTKYMRCNPTLIFSIYHSLMWLPEHTTEKQPATGSR